MAVDLLPFARHLAGRLGSAPVIDVGAGLPSASLVDGAVLVGDGLLDGPADPGPLLAALRALMERAAICLVSSTDGERSRTLLRNAGLAPVFSGRTATDAGDELHRTGLQILERSFGGLSAGLATPVPPGFQVIALVAVYNEADVIVPFLNRLIGEGLEVYVIDNWSTDGTYALVEPFLGRGVVGIERFPESGPVDGCESAGLLGRKEEFARRFQADWFVHLDVDEVRLAPWYGIGYREGLWAVSQAGYNAVDHTEIVFHPVDDSYAPGSDFNAYFRHFEFGKRPGNFLRINSWKNTGEKAVGLARKGGHEVAFEGRRVFPYKFLLKHFPFRSQAHGERKVFLERKVRWSAEERARGWHTHYDALEPGCSFLRDPATLEPWDEADFGRRWLVQRLSGVGILP